MLRYAMGDLFESGAEALVNTVNCKGAMGKGLALQFRHKYPAMYGSYRKACRDGQLRPGTLHTYREGGVWIVNFPTKDDWRKPSKIEYVRDGLDALADFMRANSIGSIAVPPLGCGLGGLRWDQVKQVIEDKLSPLAVDTDIIVYEPVV